MCSSHISSSKRKRTSERMSSSFWIPWEIKMLGGNEFRLRQGFAFGETLVRRKRAAAQKGRWVVFLFTVLKLQISILTVPSTSEQSTLCPDVFLCLWQKKMSSARSLAPPFQLQPAALGSRLACRPAGGFFPIRPSIFFINTGQAEQDYATYSAYF